eukprot:SM000130S27137  [mRNA]  locus=s130:394245:395695:- [translate_table: standard]
MTNTWRRSPGRPAATPAARAEIRRRRATAERQLGAPTAARREQVRAGGATAGGCHKRCTAYAEGIAGTPPNKPATSGWTGIQLHRRFLNASKRHCRSPRRLDRPSVAPPILNSRKERCRSPRRLDRRSIAPPIPELKQRALPLFQVLLHALCRQFASFAGVPSHARPSVAEPTCGWMELPQRDADFLGGHEGVEIVDEGGPRASHGLVAKVGVANSQAETVQKRLRELVQDLAR